MLFRSDNGALFTNSTRNFVDLDPVTNTVTRKSFGAVQWLGDLKYWRIAAGQEWNEKWATHVFYNNYEFDRRFVGDLNNDFVEWGLGVRYTYNPNVKFGLNFVKIDWDQNTWRDAAGNVIATRNDDHIIRFRTEVSF